jgi:hypothetical protein
MKGPSAVEDSAIESVVFPQPVLHFEGVAFPERAQVYIKTSAHILRMHALRPSIPQLLLNVPSVKSSHFRLK